MKIYIEERILKHANYIINTKSTVRETAKNFKTSKSTVHKDVSERLKQINERLFYKVRNVLELNKSERHIRGGLVTQEKYATLRLNKNKSIYRQKSRTMVGE